MRRQHNTRNYTALTRIMQEDLIRNQVLLHGLGALHVNPQVLHTLRVFTMTPSWIHKCFSVS